MTNFVSDVQAHGIALLVCIHPDNGTLGPENHLRAILLVDPLQAHAVRLSSQVFCFYVGLGGANGMRHVFDLRDLINLFGEGVGTQHFSTI